MIKAWSTILAGSLGAIVAMGLTGCAPAGLTEEQLAMQEAGPYVEEGSDKALEACTLVASLKTQVDDGAIVGSDLEYDNVFANTIIDATNLGYLAFEQSYRYSEIYASIASIDAAILNDDLAAVFVLLDDAAEQCSNMTAVDYEELVDRGIDIEPGDLPNVK